MDIIIYILSRVWRPITWFAHRFRRVALYGVDYLIEQKKHEYEHLAEKSTQETIRLREEISEQIRALEVSRSSSKSCLPFYIQFYYVLIC